MPAYVAIQPRVRPITSTSITRSCDSAVVVIRSIASVAICTAVSKPNVTSVAAMSLSIVFGTPTSGTPSSASRSAVRSVPSPPITTTASRPSRASAPVTGAAPSPWTYGSRRDVPRIVPPRWRIPRTASRSSGRSRPSISPSQPSRIPTTSAPCLPIARAVTLRITALSPGQSPPAVRIPSRFTSVQEHRLAGDVPQLWSVALDVVELVHVDALDAFAGGGDRHSRVGPVAKRDHPTGGAFEREVGRHHGVVRRDHQVERVRGAGAHQVPDLLHDH